MSKLSSFLHVARFIAGPTLAGLGVPLPVIPLIMHGIEIAENATNDDGTPKTGPEKKAIALDAVKTGLDALNTVKPGSVDPAVTDLVDKGIDTTIGVINVIQTKGKSTT